MDVTFSISRQYDIAEKCRHPSVTGARAPGYKGKVFLTIVPKEMSSEFQIAA